MTARSFQFRGYTIWRDPVAAYCGAAPWFAALDPDNLPDTDETPFPDEPEYFANMASPQEAMRRINVALHPHTEPAATDYWAERAREHDRLLAEQAEAEHEADFFTDKAAEL